MYQRILLAVDGSVAGESALREAVELASTHKGTIRVLHVIAMPCSDASPGDQAVREEFLGTLMVMGTKIVRHAIDTIRSHGVAAEAVMVELGKRSVADEIIAQAHQWGASVIVLGTHPLGIDARVGANTREVLANSTVPVLSINAEGRRVSTRSCAEGELAVAK